MPKVVWSVLEQGSHITQPLADKFREFLPQSQVEVTNIMWENYKQEMTSMAIYGHGIDVSQVGAPVVNDLVAMNALRPFTPREMVLLGGENAFTAAAWQSSLRFTENKTWAIPLISDSYAITYWGDLLEKAGVEEKQAFTLEHIEETFQRLRESGIEYPWLTNFHTNKFTSIHGASSWVWAQNTDFVSANGREALFIGPAALAGLKAYFRLSRYVSPASLSFDTQEYNRLFLERRAAATICAMGTSNTWYQSLSPELRPHLKIASPPGQPLVGGSSLVIWKSTRNEDLAFNLVKFLVSPEVQAGYPLQMGHMPVRREVLSQPPFSTNPLLQSYVDILAQGRAFLPVKFGGLLEEQFAQILTRIWHIVLSEPDTNLDEILLQKLVQSPAAMKI